VTDNEGWRRKTFVGWDNDAVDDSIINHIGTQLRHPFATVALRLSRISTTF
jgi:hypothetical protein